MLRSIRPGSLALISLWTCANGVAWAAGPHGGAVAKSGPHQFEVVFRKDGLTVYPLMPPATVAKLTGAASFTLAGAPKPFVYTLRGAGPSALGVAVDLGKVPAAGTEVTFAIAGLPDPTAPTASFQVPFAPVPVPVPVAVAAAPARPAAGPIAVTSATAADQAAINAQRVCKVSGEPLGSMGAPIKVIRGDRAIYLCCKSCLKTVRGEPARYFGP